MRTRIIHVLNWDKYQARSDKELPWIKLYGRLFKVPWFQLLDDDEKFCAIAILDLARQFNNKITEECLFKGYLKGNYGLRMTEERIFKLCKSLSDNEFLSDNTCTDVVLDKIRVDKIREISPTTPSNKGKYGEHGLVLLTEEEHKKLISRLGEAFNTYVSRLEKYIGSTGRKYKSHYFTILNWYGKDHDASTSKVSKPARFVV